MTSKEKNIAVYQSALSFLGEIIPDGMTKQDLEKYYVGNKFNYNSLTDIFEQLIARHKIIRECRILSNILNGATE